MSSITLSIGNDSMVCPSLPDMVSAVKSEFKIASSVDSIVAKTMETYHHFLLLSSR